MNHIPAFTGDRLWDEIFKAVIDTMPEQLFPLFKEVFGKEYPPGSAVRLLATEHSTYLDHPTQPPSSKLMDIALLVAGTDYYHIECQMHNDWQLVLRMIAYDLHFSLLHTASAGPGTGEVTIRFPQSVIIYPDQNSALPDRLRCRILFPDQSEYTYQIPTVRIQSYSLGEIHQKHLNLFLPYVLLRLKPRLKQSSPLTKEELTSFINAIIVILEEDVASGYLTPQQSYDYIQLLTHASRHIFQKYPHYHEEVLQLTKPLIKLPSVELREAYEELNRIQAELANRRNELADSEARLADSEAKLADKDAKLADKDAELADKDAELADKDAELADKDAKLADKDAKLADKDAKLADKDAEIARLKRLLMEKNS